jgi:heat shock protein beta
VSIQKADVKLDETEEEVKRFNKMKDMYKPLTDWWKEHLTTLTESGAMSQSGVKIDGVTLSKRLVNSPCVVVTSQFGYSAHQEKIMRAQAFQNKDQIQMMAGRKTLEINGNHPVVYDLLQKVKDNKDDSNARESAETLFQTAMIESGYEISDPSDLAMRVYRLMSQQLGVDPDEPVKDIELPEEEEEADTTEETEEESSEEAEEESSEEASEEKKEEEL